VNHHMVTPPSPPSPVVSRLAGEDRSGCCRSLTAALFRVRVLTAWVAGREHGQVRAAPPSVAVADLAAWDSPVLGASLRARASVSRGLSDDTLKLRRRAVRYSSFQTLAIPRYRPESARRTKGGGDYAVDGPGFDRHRASSIPSVPIIASRAAAERLSPRGCLIRPRLGHALHAPVAEGAHIKGSYIGPCRRMGNSGIYGGGK